VTNIKICGITRREDALLAQELGAHALGFIFAKSPRRITASAAAEITRELSPLIHRVGVFVNEDIKTILSTVTEARLSMVQLHGDETESDITALKQHVLTIKAFQVHDQSDFTAIAASPADGILLDAYSKTARGGLGKTFNWDCIPPSLRTRIILAGGIGAHNVAEAIRSVTPLGIDASSTLEASPGIKSGERLRSFFAALTKEQITERTPHI
jgi:phosphoribosylanthranilate isomerase